VKESILFFSVIPAKAGIQACPGKSQEPLKTLGLDFYRESWTPVFTGETAQIQFLHGF
jgi:hypothetical protein